jgi:outer membrane immunogenic protein
MKSFILTVAVLLVTPAFANDNSMLKDLDSLGSNKGIAERAKAIDSRNRVRVVQNRIVDRTLRLEMAMSYDTAAGGDSYVRSNNLGAMADFHIIPRLSVGARYYDTRNELTAEGERQMKNHAANPTVYRQPDIDYASSTTLGVISFYPLYGKLNFFDMGVTQFDVYMMAGYGEIKLASGAAPTWAAGGGVGIWWSQHITTRLEGRYQAYEDKLLDGTARDQNITAFSFALGVML